MARFIVRRVIAMIGVLFAISVIVLSGVALATSVDIISLTFIATSWLLPPISTDGQVLD